MQVGPELISANRSSLGQGAGGLEADGNVPRI